MIRLVHSEIGEDDDLQNSRASKITAVPEVRCRHHVLWVEHLLCEFWNCDSAEGGGTAAGERSEANHEEV